MTTGRLAGKTAFITGIAGGQGRAAARLFAREGAYVIGCDVKQKESAETEAIVRGEGGQMSAFSPVDLAAVGEAQRWIQQGVEARGRLDILYNNAGAVRFRNICDMEPEDWSFTLRNEIDLIFHACKAAWPYLIAHGGSIINIASVSAYRGNPQLGAGAHAAAKGAVISYTRQLAAEGALHQIRVNSISPGGVDSPALAALPPEKRVALDKEFPLGRIGRPEDIAYCALYLASDEACWVTGADFVIDGGVNAVRR